MVLVKYLIILWRNPTFGQKSKWIWAVWKKEEIRSGGLFKKRGLELPFEICLSLSSRQRLSEQDFVSGGGAKVRGNKIEEWEDLETLPDEYFFVFGMF